MEDGCEEGRNGEGGIKRVREGRRKNKRGRRQGNDGKEEEQGK